MKVSELIEFLQRQPQEIEVVYQCFSEQRLLEQDLITIGKFCLPRPDGWVHDNRPDKPSQEYLCFPGN